MFFCSILFFFPNWELLRVEQVVFLNRAWVLSLPFLQLVLNIPFHELGMVKLRNLSARFNFYRITFEQYEPRFLPGKTMDTMFFTELRSSSVRLVKVLKPLLFDVTIFFNIIVQILIILGIHNVASYD